MFKFKEICDILTEGVYDPAIFKAIYIVGGPGTGKKTLGKKITAGLGFAYISSDEIFEYLKKNDNLDMTSMDDEDYRSTQDTRRKARKIMYRKKDTAISGRRGLLIDTPGYGDYVLQDKEFLESKGYDCYMIFVQTSIDTSLKRNNQRERKVPEKAVKEIYNSVMKNRDRYEKIFGKKFMLVKNNDSDNVDTDELWKIVKKISEEPITNYAAKKWIKRKLRDKDTSDKL